MPSTGAAFRREYLSHFYEGKPPAGATCVFRLDPTAGMKQYNDNSALIIALWDGKNTYVHNIIALRLEYVDLRRLISQNRLPFIARRASSNARRRACRSRATYDKAPRVLDVCATRDKMARVQSVTPWLEAGRIFFRRGDHYDAFVEEALRFPSTAKDDRVDVLTQLLEVIRTSSMPQLGMTLETLNAFFNGMGRRRPPSTALPG